MSVATMNGGRVRERPRRLLRSVAIMAVLGLAVTACGEDDGESAEAAETGDEETSVPEGDDAGDAGAVSDEPQLTPAPDPGAGGVVADAGSFTVRLGYGLGEGSPMDEGARLFKDIVEARTEGRVSVDLFPSDQLGGNNDRMVQLQSGTLEMTITGTSPAATYVPGLQLFDLPFLFPTAEAADAVMDGEIGQELMAEFESSGMKGLGFMENGYRQLTNNSRAVSSPDDIDGLKLRTLQSDLQVDLWNTLGANPTPIAFPELFSALEQGVVDGQENPWNTILTQNFFEVQQHGSSTGHVYQPFAVLASKQWWDGLDPSYQALFEEAWGVANEWQRTISREIDTWSRERLIEEGMQITVLSPDELVAFEEAVQPVYEEWGSQIGTDLLERARQVIGEVG